MRLIKQIKQKMCKHNMNRIDTYEIKTYRDSRLIDSKICLDYICSKCGKRKTDTMPQFIPHYKSIYNNFSR